MDPATQSELFSEYFASIFIKSRTRTALVDTIDDFDVSDTTIIGICQKLDIKKDTDPDGIPIAESLSQFFYKVKQTRTSSKIWKQSRVSPVYKNGNKVDFENFRPVSILKS